MITQFYLIIGAVLFTLGALGVLIRRSTIVVFMCIELMLNAVNLTFVALAREFADLQGQVAVFFMFPIAAAEAAVGLSIILAVFRNFYSVEVDDAQELKG